MADEQEPQGTPPTEPNEPQGSPTTEPPASAAPPAGETDWKAEARKWEARAKKDAAALARVTEAITEKDDSLSAAQAATEEAKTVALRYRIAAQFTLPPDLADRLTGTTEDEIKADAEALAKYAAPGAPPRTDARRGTGTPPPPPAKPTPDELLRRIAGH